MCIFIYKQIDMHNFGKIKHNIYEIAVDGITEKNNDKKAILKKFVKTIKESEILKTQARIYYNLENKVNESEYIATEYVKENIALLQKYNLQDIVRENKKLEVLLEGHEVAEIYDRFELHENIHNLIVTKRSANTIDNIVESTNVIKEYIISNKQREIVSEANDYIPNSMLTKFLTEKYNDKYSNMSEVDRKLVKSIIESDEAGQESILEEVKKNALVLVNQRLSENAELELREKLLNVKERILETKYAKEDFAPTVTKIMTLTKTLSE